MSQKDVDVGGFPCTIHYRTLNSNIFMHATCHVIAATYMIFEVTRVEPFPHKSVISHIM